MALQNLAEDLALAVLDGRAFLDETEINSVSGSPVSAPKQTPPLSVKTRFLRRLTQHHVCIAASPDTASRGHLDPVLASARSCLRLVHLPEGVYLRHIITPALSRSSPHAPPPVRVS